MQPVLETIIRMMKSAASAAYTTWDSAKKGADVTLSNGDLTFTTGVTGGVVLSVKSIASGEKKHWETTVNAVGTQIRVGIGKSTTGLVGNVLGEDLDSICYNSEGRVRSGGVLIINTGVTFTTTDLITCEFNADATTANRTLQFFKNGTSVYTVTETDLTTISGNSFAGTWYAGGCGIASPQGTANFGASAWGDTPTSGFDGITA